MGKGKRVAKTDEPDPAVAKVLAIPEVLEMILNDLDVSSLLNCRAVNTFWDKRASSVLKRRPAWIEVSASSDSFTRLYKCVSKSKDFPFPGLKLTSPEGRDRQLDRLTPKAPKYFRKFGNIHTHLQVEVTFACEEDLIENVLSQLSHIQFLGFNQLGKRDEDEWEEEELDFEQFSMPNLTTLCFDGLWGAGVTERGLKAIINAAPALEDIKNVPPGLVPTIWDDVEKVNLVSSMIIKDYMRRRISQQLITNPASLKALSILRGESDGPNQVSVTALEKVLLRSQDTLRKLVLKEMCINLDQLSVFGQLTELDITIRESQSEEDSFEMVRKLSSRCLPRLHKIRLDLDCDILKEDLSLNYVEIEEESLASVKVLELECRLVPQVATLLAKKFPCVHHIRVNHIEAGTHVWSLGVFRCLSKLDIRGFPLNPKRFSTQSMDQFLTGIPRETCAKLRTVPHFEIDPFYNEILRPAGSLIQLTGKEQLFIVHIERCPHVAINGEVKGGGRRDLLEGIVVLVHFPALKELTVSILPFGKVEELSSSENPFMSMISVWYAIKFLPGLRLTFLCRPSKLSVVKKAVEAVQDYVSVVAWTEAEVLY